MSDGSEFQVCGAATENARRANAAQTNGQTNRHYQNNGHLAVNQLYCFSAGAAIRHDTTRSS